MNWFTKNNQFFLQEQKSVAVLFPDLHYKVEGDNVYLVGSIHVDTKINDKKIYDSFRIQILFPNEYPEFYPIVFEPSHKIPKSFHMNPNNSLCLGTELEIGMIFYQNRSISNFIIHLLMPYLISFIYNRDYGVFPFGERKHGSDGKLEFYKELFDITEISSIIKFLNAIKKEKLRGHQLCPCGSRKMFRNCHWSSAQKLLIIPKKLITQEIAYFQKLLNG